MPFLRGFEAWSEALHLDSDLEGSAKEFATASEIFFSDGSDVRCETSRAFFEYSTLMDAFGEVQRGRLLRSEQKFYEALSHFAKASEILRATVHFAYVSSYISACASLETALELRPGEEYVEGLRNANALFEQAKLALSFRDDQHFLMKKIDSMIAFSVSRALLAESLFHGQSSQSSEEKPAAQGTATTFKIEYFPLDDCKRALNSAFISTFGERGGLLISNVGAHCAKIESLGKEVVDEVIEAGRSISMNIDPSLKGRLRIKYVDLATNESYDEGCLTII